MGSQDPIIEPGSFLCRDDESQLGIREIEKEKKKINP